MPLVTKACKAVLTEPLRSPMVEPGVVHYRTGVVNQLTVPFASVGAGDETWHMEERQPIRFRVVRFDALLTICQDC